MNEYLEKLIGDYIGFDKEYIAHRRSGYTITILYLDKGQTDLKKILEMPVDLLELMAFVYNKR